MTSTKHPSGAPSLQTLPSPILNSVKPWVTLDHAELPDGSKLTLRSHDGEYVIAADGYDLMVSRMHGSEEALASLALGDARK